MSKLLRDFTVYGTTGLLMLGTGSAAFAMTPEEVGEVPNQQQIRSMVWMTPNGSRPLTKRDMQKKPIPETTTYDMPVYDEYRDEKGRLHKGTRIVKGEQTTTPVFTAETDEVLFGGGRVPSTFWDPGVIHLSTNVSTDVEKLTFSDSGLMTDSYFMEGMSGLGKIFSFGFTWRFGESDDTNVYSQGGTGFGGSAYQTQEQGQASENTNIWDNTNFLKQSTNVDVDVDQKTEVKGGHKGNNGHNNGNHGGCNNRDKYGKPTCSFNVKTGELVTTINGARVSNRPAPRSYADLAAKNIYG